MSQQISASALAQPQEYETARKLKLSEEEYSRICEILGRQPNFTELSVYSVMWSEHCSYKNSIYWLKQLPKTGKGVLKGAGEENAGLVDIGNGLAVAFKIESHNHPSALEPYQGAATGVGGIHRDIFTMGARPVAALNSLRFGDPALAKTRHLLKGVVRGIGDYGNCFGVPTVGGEVFFDSCYNTNPLVNAMSVGVVRHGDTVSATAAGVGNPVFIVGSATGKDGIHGATFASADLTANSAADLPAVQVGDPFQEKLLLEATLEVIQTGAVVGMQDMGAAGIACSTSEMSAKAGVGMDIWLDRVPTRQPDMQPFELLLSESQERMLIVAHQDRKADVLRVFEKWDLPCVEIGVVTDSGLIRYYWQGELAGEIPAQSLVLGGGAPVYQREYTQPRYIDHIAAFNLANVPVLEPTALRHAAEAILRSPSVASKRWIRQQYDHTVGAATMTTTFAADAALVRVHGTEKALALTVDCNPRYVYADPFSGTALAVAEAVRNIVCSGGRPLGITNCLNFGNPYNPEVYWQFVNAVLGMKAACQAFNLPVTGGNVSFYNQSDDDGPVFPTPTIGMVGLLPDALTDQLGLAFAQNRDLVYLLGQVPNDIGSSEYCYRYRGVAHSPAPYLNLAEEVNLAQLMLKLNEAGVLNSAHDVSDGGLLTTLFESAFAANLAFNVAKPESLAGIRNDAFWFGEGGGRIVVTITPEYETLLLRLAKSFNVPAWHLGTVALEMITVEGTVWASKDYFLNLYNTALELAIGLEQDVVL
jgi:phosphoribosylformylglycinamidine synthase